MPFLNPEQFDIVHAYLRASQHRDPAIDEALGIMEKAIAGEASPGLRDLAHELYGTDEVEIDDDRPGTSETEEGIWVQAWVWISHDELVNHGLREEAEDEESPDDA